MLFAHSVRTCTRCGTEFRCWQRHAHYCESCRATPRPLGQLALFPPRQARAGSVG